MRTKYIDRNVAGSSKIYTRNEKCVSISEMPMCCRSLIKNELNIAVSFSFFFVFSRIEMISLEERETKNKESSEKWLLFFEFRPSKMDIAVEVRGSSEFFIISHIFALQ